MTVNNFSEEKQQVDYQFPLIYSVNVWNEHVRAC